MYFLQPYTLILFTLALAFNRSACTDCKDKLYLLIVILHSAKCKESTDFHKHLPHLHQLCLCQDSVAPLFLLGLPSRENCHTVIGNILSFVCLCAGCPVQSSSMLDGLYSSSRRVRQTPYVDTKGRPEWLVQQCKGKITRTSCVMIPNVFVSRVGLATFQR